jgi:hypothetical protein
MLIGDKKGENDIHRKANELNNQFIESLKVMFQGKEIEITISEVDEQIICGSPPPIGSACCRRRSI